MNKLMGNKPSQYQLAIIDTDNEINDGDYSQKLKNIARKAKIKQRKDGKIRYEQEIRTEVEKMYQDICDKIDTGTLEKYAEKGNSKVLYQTKTVNRSQYLQCQKIYDIYRSLSTLHPKYKGVKIRFKIKYKYPERIYSIFLEWK